MIYVVLFPLLISENASTNVVQKKNIAGSKKFIMVDGIMICIETDESDNLLKHFGNQMMKTAKEFIEKFPDLAIDNFGKQSDTKMTNHKLHLRLDRQKIFPKYETDWGNYQIQINSELITKNKKNPKTSLAVVLFETGYTYPKDVVKTAFKISLEKNRQVYVTVTLECDE